MAGVGKESNGYLVASNTKGIVENTIPVGDVGSSVFSGNRVSITGYSFTRNGWTGHETCFLYNRTRNEAKMITYIESENSLLIESPFTGQTNGDVIEIGRGNQFSYVAVNNLGTSPIIVNGVAEEGIIQLEAVEGLIRPTVYDTQSSTAKIITLT